MLIGYAGEESRHERLLLHDLKNGSWVVLTPDEDMYIEEVSRADSPHLWTKSAVAAWHW